MLFMYFAVLQNPEDEPLFEEFYNKFYDTVFYISKQHLRTKEAAEDCSHEVLLYFAKEFHNISHDFTDKKLWNYVRIVSKCMAIDIYRKEKKHINHVVDYDVEDFFHLSVDEFDICDEIQLKDGFDKMPEEYRYICYLKYVYELSGAQISKMLNISEPLVRKRCMLGKKYLKNYMLGENNDKI